MREAIMVVVLTSDILSSSAEAAIEGLRQLIRLLYSCNQSE